MKVVALMAWYRESPNWLAQYVANLAVHKVDHLIAVDGAYALLPAGQAHSTPDEYAALVGMADATGIGITIHTPRNVWAGNEVEKRTYMFRMAEQMTTPQDWWWVHDSDQLIKQIHKGWRTDLIRTDKDCAEVTFYEPEHPDFDGPRDKGTQELSQYTVRSLFRALPGLSVVGNHFTYQLPDGRKLWGYPLVDKLEPTLDLTSIRIEHRTRLRDPLRKEQQKAYYRDRDSQGVERGQCNVCKHRKAKHTLPTGWEKTAEGELTAGWCEACDTCKPKVIADAREQVASFGLDPDEVRVELAPAR